MVEIGECGVGNLIHDATRPPAASGRIRWSTYFYDRGGLGPSWRLGMRSLEQQSFGPTRVGYRMGCRVGYRMGCRVRCRVRGAGMMGEYGEGVRIRVCLTLTVSKR